MPKSDYARIRQQIRNDHRRGVPLWIPTPPNRKLNPMLRAMGGYFEDGTYGVPKGVVFATIAEREAAEAWIAQLPLPHVPPLPPTVTAAPAAPAAEVKVKAHAAVLRGWVEESTNAERPAPESAGAILARILRSQGTGLGEAVAQEIAR